MGWPSVSKSLTELFHRGAASPDDVSQPGHSRVLPVSAALLGRGAPSLGDLAEEPFGGTLAALPQCYTAP
eukprot:9240242-Pyramimonas_sp.AAC.1